MSSIGLLIIMILYIIIKVSQTLMNNKWAQMSRFQVVPLVPSLSTVALSLFKLENYSL